MLETLDYTIRIGSTPTILYFDLYLYSAYAAHYVYQNFKTCFLKKHTGLIQSKYLKEKYCNIYSQLTSRIE